MSHPVTRVHLPEGLILFSFKHLPAHTLKHSISIFNFPTQLSFLKIDLTLKKVFKREREKNGDNLLKRHFDTNCSEERSNILFSANLLSGVWVTCCQPKPVSST